MGSGDAVELPAHRTPGLLRGLQIPAQRHINARRHRPRYGFHGVIRQHPGFDPGLQPLGVRDGLQLCRLLILKEHDGLAIGAVEERQFQQRLAQRAVAALAVQTGHGRHARFHAVFIGHGVEPLPISFHEPADEMCAESKTG